MAPLEPPDEDITEEDTDVGDAGLSLADRCGDELIELECEMGEVTMPGGGMLAFPAPPPLACETGALYVHTIRSWSELCDSSESCRVSSSVFSELFTSSSMSIGTIDAPPIPPSRCICVCRWSSDRLVRNPAASHFRTTPPSRLLALAPPPPLLLALMRLELWPPPAAPPLLDCEDWG